MTPLKPTSRPLSTHSRTALWRRQRRRRTENKNHSIAKEYAYLTRFPAPHPFSEEYPADHTGDEVCVRGPAAESAGSGAGGPAVRKGTGAGAAFDDGAGRVAATSFAGAQAGRAHSGDCAVG